MVENRDRRDGVPMKTESWNGVPDSLLLNMELDDFPWDDPICRNKLMDTLEAYLRGMGRDWVEENLALVRLQIEDEVQARAELDESEVLVR